MWAVYTVSRIAWEVTIIVEYPPDSIIMGVIVWFFSGAVYIFMCAILHEICKTSVTLPISSQHCFQEDHPPAYEDVVLSCVDMESEAASRKDVSPPPYRPYAHEPVYPM